MKLERIPLGVIVERLPARSRWLDHVWRVAGVLVGRPETPAWTVLAQADRAQADGVTRYYAGTAELVLHPGETKVYRHNLQAERPAVYVVLRRSGTPPGWRLLLVTADPAEAHAHADVGDDLLEAVPMPRPVLDRLSAFVARHHVERKEWRRRRDRTDPEALASRRPRPHARPRFGEKA